MSIIHLPKEDGNLNLQNLIRSTHPPKTSNVVSTVDLGTKLDLVKIAHHIKGAEYNPRTFSGAKIREISLGATVLVFESGKMVCTGAKSIELSLQATRTYAKMIKKVGFDQVLILENQQIQMEYNAMKVKGSFTQYEPEIFPGLIYRKIENSKKITLLIFVSGRCVITGGKSEKEIVDAFLYILPILQQFEKKNNEHI